MPAFLGCREPAEAVHDVTTVQTTHAVRGARTLIEPERLMKPSLKRGSKKYASAGARGEHKRTVSATPRVKEGDEIRPLAVLLPSFHHDHLDHQERRRQEARSEEKRFDQRRRHWSSPFRRARGTRRSELRWIPRGAIEKERVERPQRETDGYDQTRDQRRVGGYGAERDEPG